MNKIIVEVSVGELLDKISILEIKKEKIKDPEKLKFISNEHSILKDQLEKNVKSDDKLNKLFQDLKENILRIYGYSTRIATAIANRATSTPNIQVFAGTQTPKIKVIDFLTGLFKMFNLTAYQEDDLIVVRTLDSFYASSTATHDITEYVDKTSSEVNAIMPYSEIELTYKDTEAIIASKHREFSNLEWGTAHFNNKGIYEGDSYTIDVPFEHHKFERMLDAGNNNAQTAIQWGWSVDIKQETYLGEPLIFYAKKITSGTQIGVVKTSANRVGITDYYIPSNSVDITKSQNINFKAEFNEYAGTVFQSTLFETYYSNYIGDTVDQKRRLSKFKAYLPLRILLNLSLADRIIIFDKIYKINELTTNLATGVSDLELINEVSDFVIENQDKYFADSVDKRFLTVDSTNVTVDWNGTV